MSDDAWLRRQAVMVASQLPESPDQAQRVLELAMELLESFIRPRSGPGVAQDRVLRLVGAPATPSRSASSRGSLEASPNQSQSTVKPGTV